MAIFAATELDRFASDILEARGVSSVFKEQSEGTTHEPENSKLQQEQQHSLRNQSDADG